MADINRLGIFNQINNAGGRSVVQFQVGTNQAFQHGGTYHCLRILGRTIVRTSDSRALNRATRQEFLERLVDVLHDEIANPKDGGPVIELGTGEAVGDLKTGGYTKYKITSDVVNRLAEVLGDKVFDSKDFAVDADGITTSRPLTERRITAIRKAIAEKFPVVKLSDEDLSAEDLSVRDLNTVLERQVDAHALRKLAGWFGFLSDKVGIGREFSICERFVKDFYGAAEYEKLNDNELDAFTKIVKALYESDGTAFFKAAKSFNDILRKKPNSREFDAYAFFCQLGSSIENNMMRYVRKFMLEDSVTWGDLSGEQLNWLGGGFCDKSSSFDVRAEVGADAVKYTSEFKRIPARYNERRQMRGSARPVINFGVSRLVRGDDVEQAKFIRFGAMGIAPWRYEETQEGQQVRLARENTFCQSLALGVLLNNEKLQGQVAEQKAKDSNAGNKNNPINITVPIYRVDMAEYRNLTSGRWGGLMYTFKDDDTVPEKLRGITVYITPEVHRFCVPVDSYIRGNNVKGNGVKNQIMTQRDLSETVKQLESLLADAEAALAESNPVKGLIDVSASDTNMEAINALYASLSAYKRAVLDADENEGNGLVGRGRGEEMMRFGSQVAMLAILLGHTPAINCNMGIDRTGLMDARIKQLAVTLGQSPCVVPQLYKKVSGGKNNDQNLCSLFVECTGNHTMVGINWMKKGDRRVTNVNQSNGFSGLLHSYKLVLDKSGCRINREAYRGCKKFTLQKKKGRAPVEKK